MSSWNLLYEELKQVDPNYTVCERYVSDAGNTKPPDDLASDILAMIERRMPSDRTTHALLDDGRLEQLHKAVYELVHPDDTPGRHAVCWLAVAVAITISGLAILMWAYGRRN